MFNINVSPLNANYPYDTNNTFRYQNVMQSNVNCNTSDFEESLLRIICFEIMTE